MKVKKALKRLGKVEELLSEVVDHYSSIEQSAHDLLVSARLLVVRAKDSVRVQLPSNSARKPTLEAEKSDKTKGGKKILHAARKQPAAKRKGVNALNRQRTRKSA